MKHLHIPADNEILRGKHYRQLYELIMANQVKINGSGLTLQQTSSGRFISTSHSKLDTVHGALAPPGEGAAVATMLGRIKSATAYVDNIWTYTFVRVHKTAMTGYEAGAFFEDWDTPVAAWNMCEYMNSGVGVQGNGVDVDNLTGTFALQPCPVGNIVRIDAYSVGTSGAVEYWFEYQNGVDGEC